MDIQHVVLFGLRLLLLGLALGLTVISYRAYAYRKTDRLQYAFVGFAFISMGVALVTLTTQLSATPTTVQILETIPFIVGFVMLYISMYR